MSFLVCIFYTCTLCIKKLKLHIIHMYERIAQRSARIMNSADHQRIKNGGLSVIGRSSIRPIRAMGRHPQSPFLKFQIIIDM